MSGPQGMFDPVPPVGILELEMTKNGYALDIHPGIGCVTLCRNGVEYRKDAMGKRDLIWFEAVIRREALPHRPTPVWTLHIDGPFRSLLYALTPEHGWALLDAKDGFA